MGCDTFVEMIHLVINLPKFPFPIDLMSYMKQEALTAAFIGSINLVERNSEHLKEVKHNLTVAKDGLSVYSSSLVYTSAFWILINYVILASLASVFPVN